MFEIRSFRTTQLLLQITKLIRIVLNRYIRLRRHWNCGGNAPIRGNNFIIFLSSVNFVVCVNTTISQLVTVFPVVLPMRFHIRQH